MQPQLSVRQGVHLEDKLGMIISPGRERLEGGGDSVIFTRKRCVFGHQVSSLANFACSLVSHSLAH